MEDSVLTDSNGRGDAARNGHAPLGHDDLGALLATLVDCAGRPLEEARAMPGAWFTSEALYALEQERIFRREWLCVGRVEEIARPGDWLSVDVAGEAVMVVRTQGGDIRALSRVCPHRFMDLLAEHDGDRGSSESFVCPYHSWAFSHEGKLTGAPLMGRSTLFERERGSICLPSFQVEVWHGFVFVNLDAEAAPLAPRLADAEPLIERYRLDEWKFVDRLDWPVSDSNWKLAMDNGRESYHNQGAHKKTVEPLWPSALCDADTTESKYWYAQHMHVSPEAAIGQEDGHYLNPLVFPALDGLTPFDRSQYLLLGVYPSMFFTAGPDMLFYATWLPTGPTTHKFDLSVCVHESHLDDPELERIIAENHEWLVEIQSEDALVLPAIQRMLGARGATAQGGPLSHLERPIWQFQRYMADRLAGAQAEIGA
jgi:phenylpropionate dioxygenase-like ring-hydroxylating dioxygenase large terminal subunit